MSGCDPGRDARGLVVRCARPDELELCLAIRRRVFVEGQGVPEAIEIDGRDAACVHLVARRNGDAVGTARLRPYEGGAAKIERVAVVAAERGRGIGRALMEAAEREARASGFTAAVLHAQEAVAGFYEALGYRCEGPTFLEADIPHVRMAKPL